ncbi:MAG: peptidoglycan-binding protein [Eubacterium sp.]|nr:peptidoglycan-binding protein [Eubacterium sp.]
MKGIDLYQGDSKNGTSSVLKTIPEKAYRESDFVIVKSTQGLSYGHTSFFYHMTDRTLSDGKLAGAYHYAAGHDPEREADYFISIVKPYLGKIILCLDWESGQNAAWGETSWAKHFVEHVRKTTGLTTFLYTGLEGSRQCSNLIGLSPLWFAGYPRPLSKNWTVPAFHYNLGKWKDYAIWQYTNSGEEVDRNTTVLTESEWMSYAGPVQDAPDNKAYPGIIPALPPRGYYQLYDGMTTLKDYPTQIKRLQTALNWALADSPGYQPLTVDGKYGKNTEAAVKLYQKTYGLKEDGLWGRECNEELERISLYNKRNAVNRT